MKAIELKINLKIEDVNLIISALDELPRRISNDLVNNIISQSEIQIEDLKKKDNKK